MNIRGVEAILCQNSCTERLSQFWARTASRVDFTDQADQSAAKILNVYRDARRTSGKDFGWTLSVEIEAPIVVVVGGVVAGGTGAACERSGNRFRRSTRREPP